MHARIALTLAALTFAGCASTTPPGPEAEARLEPTQGNTTRGALRFVQEGDSVRVTGEVQGLKPGSEHGFHIHEKGDCSSGDGMSAGGHFNPGNTPHGHFGHGSHHTGDLPSLRANASGVAPVDFKTRTLSIGHGATDIVGRGLIVHRDPDDFTSQPAGNAGPRLACAVIRRK